MTIQTKTVRVKQEREISITCDKCGETTIREDDPLEYQEYHTIKFIGGYSSVFGDGVKVECDLCQSCLLKLINPYFRSTDQN